MALYYMFFIKNRSHCNEVCSNWRKHGKAGNSTIYMMPMGAERSAHDDQREAMTQGLDQSLVLSKPVDEGSEMVFFSCLFGRKTGVGTKKSKCHIMFCFCLDKYLGNKGIKDDLDIPTACSVVLAIISFHSLLQKCFT